MLCQHLWKGDVMLGVMLVFVAVIQLILHYLGWIGMLLGTVALLFGNSTRGVELLIGGVSFIVLKYVIGIVFLTPIHIAASRREKRDRECLLDDSETI